MAKKKRLSQEMYPTADLGNVIKIPIDETFGIVSDTHFGSAHQGLDNLHKMYDDFDNAGVEQVFHAGDLTDGERVYRGHNRYLKHHGYEAQANWTIAKYPEIEGIKTYIIAGNHDLSFFIQSQADIVKYVCNYRKDLDYAGMIYARFQDGQFKLDTLHPAGGGYYSKSYGVQKWIRNNEMPKTYPDMMVFGHWHTHGYFSDHGVDALLAGNFQDPNEYHIRRGYTGSSGGWIVETDRTSKGKLEGLKLDWRGKK